MNHTPTPWREGSEACGAIVTDNVEARLVGESMSQADRQFILRACNAYDRALKTLKLAEQYLAARVEGTGGVGDMDVLPAVREAIADLEAP